MKTMRALRTMMKAAPVAALTAAFLNACSDDRDGFTERDQEFRSDASIDATECKSQCSVDGRSVVEACTGKIVETCKPDLACGAGVCQDPCGAAAADRSSNGCDFYFQSPAMTLRSPSCYAGYVVNTSLQPVELTLELDGTKLDLSNATFRTTPGSAALIPHVGPIPAGESVIVFLSDANPNLNLPVSEMAYRIGCPRGATPATYLELASSIGTRIGTSLHLTTNVPVSLTTIYPFGGAESYMPSASLILPRTSWGQQHIVVNGWAEALAGLHGGEPAAQIVASEDDTEISILPSHDIQSGMNGVAGGPAGVPITYRLGKGQYLQLVQSEELSGSIVTSTKPTTIFGGHSCANIPVTAGACDTLAQQLPAFEQWGSEYVGVGYRPRLGNEHERVPYRIVAARDGTRLDYDPAVPPGAPLTMSAGEVVTFESGTGDAFVVRTQDDEHAIYLAAYMTGGGGDVFGTPGSQGYGDPEFVNVVPAKQYLSSYSFYADPTYPETSLVIVRAKTGGEFKDVWLECAGTLTGWKPVGMRGEYEFVRVDLSRQRGPGDSFGTSVCQTGLQRMRSDGPFTATVWGWGPYASYAYPGGMAQRKLVETPLDPVR